MGSSSAWHTSEWLAACCGPTVKVWNPVSAEKTKEMKLSEGTPVYALDWSTNNKVLAAAGDKAQVSMYGAGPQLIGQIPNVVEASIDSVTCLRFSHDSKKLVLGCKNRSMHILDLRQQGSNSRSNVDHRSSLCSLAISPDDSLIASSSMTGQILLHDYKSGSKLVALSTDGPVQRSLTFSSTEPDLLAAAADDGRVCIWSVRKRLVKHQCPGKHQGGATGVAFAAGSSTLVYTCGKDQKLVGVDTRQQQETFSLQALQPLSSLCARFDGRLLAAGTASGGVLVFDLRSMQQALAMYNFSESAPVLDVRWQKAPHVSSRAKAAAAAAAGSGSTLASSSAAPDAAAGALGRSSAGGADARGRHAELAAGAARLGGYSEGGLAGVTPESSRMSDGDADHHLRAVSPVQLSSSPSESANTAATSAVTPADSGATSMASMGPYMATPGIGVTRGLGDLGANATPISRFQQTAATGAAAAVPAAGKEQLQQRPSGEPAGLPYGSQRVPAGSAAVNGGIPAAASRPPIGDSSSARQPGTAEAGRSREPSAGGTQAAAVGGASGTSSSRTAAAAATQQAAAAAARPGSRSSSSGRNSSQPPSRRASLGGAASEALPSGGAGAAASGQATEAAAAAGTGRDAVSSIGDRGPSNGISSSAATVARQQSAAGGPKAAALQQQQQFSLREDVFKAYVDDQMQAVRQDVRALHLDMLKQFHQAQMDLASVVEGLVARQEVMADQLATLTAQVAQLTGKDQDFSIAWL